jgi:hypothetical protein
MSSYRTAVSSTNTIDALSSNTYEWQDLNGGVPVSGGLRQLSGSLQLEVVMYPSGNPPESWKFRVHNPNNDEVSFTLSVVSDIS